MTFRPGLATALLLLLPLSGCRESAPPSPEPAEIRNASYDATRQFYAEVNRAFASRWKAQTGQDVTIGMSHGGSSNQARAIIEGFPADVATLALGHDIDEIARLTGRIPPDWRTRLPANSAPYTSTIVFLVRAGNPKGIRDWADLVRADVEVISPNPKASGSARWIFLAAWSYGRKEGGSEEHAQDFTARLFSKIPHLAGGSREATTSFALRRAGDVLLTWENEALLAREEFGPDAFEVVVPSISILAEPAVAVVEANARRHGAETVARAYLHFLYSREGQEIAARHHYRPRMTMVAKQYGGRFPALDLATVDGDFGGWEAAHRRFFADGALFDRITQGDGGRNRPGQ